MDEDEPQLRYRSVFISDVHLGTRGCQAELLLDFIRCFSCDRLYLVGDILDGWKLKGGWWWPQAHNDVVQKILRLARKGVAVTYIPGNHDEVVRGFFGVHFGGVVVARDASPAPHGLIGVGIADTESCRDALTFALEEASLRHAGLHAVHSWRTPQSDITRAGPVPTESGAEAAADAASQLAGLLDECRAKYPDVKVTHEVVHGHPGRALVGLSARADLVVIGRRAGAPGPGSVRHALLNHAHGPVAIVPS